MPYHQMVERGWRLCNAFVSTFDIPDCDGDGHTDGFPVTVLRCAIKIELFGLPNSE